MPWTVNSEIYPLWARSTGNACSSGINWMFNVLVSLTFLHTAEYLTYYGKRIFFPSIVSFLFFLFFLYVLSFGFKRVDGYIFAILSMSTWLSYSPKALEMNLGKEKSNSLLSSMAAHPSVLYSPHPIQPKHLLAVAPVGNLHRRLLF